MTRFKRATRLLGRGPDIFARLREFVAHHGPWAPGIRLLRNLQLGGKAWLLAACVGLPMAALATAVAVAEYERHEASRRRLTALHDMRSLGVLTGSLTEVLKPALRAELGLGDAGLAPALAADEQRFRAFADAARQHAADLGVGAAFDSLLERRDAMLARQADPSRSALPGRGGPRIEAIAAYGRELAALRFALARASATAADAPAPMRALIEVASHALPELRWRIGAVIRTAAPLYDAADRGMRTDRLTMQATQAGVLLETARAELAYAAANGLLDAGSAERALESIQSLLDRANALARAARQVGSGQALAAMAGDRSALLAAGRAALAQADALDQAVLARLLDGAQARATADARRAGGLAALLGAWLLASGYLLICTFRVMAGGLQTLCARLEAVGRGDLSPRPEPHGRDEIGRALTALRAATVHMGALFGAVTQGVAAVSHAAREVAGGNAGLAGRTGAVRTLIAGVSARAEGCSSSLDTCGAQVEQTAELILGMRADGQRSRKAMTGLRDGMARLQGKSRDIGQVVGLVEAVAYQIKLLSINASVEAARAGPEGRGFAVVAQEVRSLAARSEQAARRINQIVGSSIEEIDAGGILAERAGDAVRSTEQRIESVDGLMREAVNLTRSGRNEAQEVLTIARSLEESMAGNVRVVEQLADASASLREQGDSLKRSVQHFVLG